VLVLCCPAVQLVGLSPQQFIMLLKCDPNLLSLANLPAKIHYIAEGMQWDRQQLLAQLSVSTVLQHVCCLWLFLGGVLYNAAPHSPTPRTQFQGPKRFP
jgi:hypothetical protein